MHPAYVVTVDILLPPLPSGVKPYFAQFPFPPADEYKLINQIRRLWLLLKWAWRCQVMVLDSTSGALQPDLFACVLMRLFPRRPLVVMTGDMWNKGKPFKYWLQKIALRLADPSIQRYIVHSTDEKISFPQVWGVAPEKVHVCLYNFTFTEAEINGGAIAATGYIFAGGNPHRDYATLLEVARRLPQHCFIIATRLSLGELPPNVKVVQVPHGEFVRLMREADMVITPMRANLTRTTGQQTYLNAMRMGKISIVNGNQVYGVKDYIHDGVDGIITDGTVEGYIQAIEWVYNPENAAQVQQMGELAQTRALEFTFERHIHTMAQIIEGAWLELPSKEGGGA